MWVRKFGVIFLALVMAGCASTGGYPDRPESVKAKLASLQKKYFLPGTDVLDAYDGLRTAQEKKTYRDAVVYGRLLALDMQFSLFKKTIYREATDSNLSLDVLGVGVGAAGAATTSADASRILSALSGGISGTRTAINKDLYYEKTMPALLALMDADRLKIRAQILRGLTQEVSVYPLGRALSDLEDYYQAGSIPGAIAAVVSTAGQTQASANTALTFVRTEEFENPKVQQLLATALNEVDQLPAGKAWDILQKPPGNIDPPVMSVIKARLGGVELINAGKILGGAANDKNAKAILKMVLVLMSDRSLENIEKWEATVRSELESKQ